MSSFYCTSWANLARKKGKLPLLLTYASHLPLQLTLVGYQITQQFTDFGTEVQRCIEQLSQEYRRRIGMWLNAKGMSFCASYKLQPGIPVWPWRLNRWEIMKDAFSLHHSFFPLDPAMTGDITAQVPNSTYPCKIYVFQPLHVICPCACTR